MEQGADDADKNHVLFSKDTEKKGHGGKAAQTSAETVAEGYHLTGDHAGDQDPHEQNDPGVLKACVIEKPECNDIGEAELDPWNGSQRRNHGFHHKDGQRDGRIHGKKSHMFYFHCKLSIFMIS